VLETGTAPHATVIGPGAVIVGKGAGSTVIILDTDARGLPHASVAVHVSVIVPPHPFGAAVNVDGFDVPLTKHEPLNPFVNPIVLGAGVEPHATVMGPGAVIVGNGAGSTVIVLETGASGLPHGSVAVQVSVTVPPLQPPGAAVNVDGLDVPLIKHAPLPPLEKVTVLAAGIEPQATVISPGATIVGNGAGSTVITLVTGVSGLPHASVAVHVSVTLPPHPPGAALKVEGFDVPVIKQAPVPLFVYGNVLEAGNAPQATVIGPGAVIVGSDAGSTVITLVTGASGLPHASVAVHVSVIVPPHPPGAAVKVDGSDVPEIKQTPLPLFV
jgi:hypothetical protein